MAKRVGNQEAVYNSSGITLSDGDETGLFVDSAGNLLTASGTGSSSNQVQGTAADNAAAVGNPVLTSGKYNTSAPTYDNGDVATTQVDVNGNQKVREQYAPGYEDNTVGVAKVEQRFSYQHIATATTTTLKSASGFLHGIVVQGGTAGTVIVYDNTTASGTIIASFDSTNALGSYTFNAAFGTGLTVITGAATKLTVTYR